MGGRIPFEAHRAAVLALLEPLRSRPAETVDVADALDRVTAAPVVSPIDLPPFRNAQMDGFAVRSVDAASGAVLPVAGESAAAPGAPAPLAPGTAVRIMTGAPVPAGADAVVPVEDTEAVGDRVRVLRGRAAGEFVREAGSDLAAGAVLLPAGVRLASRHLAALAAAGLTTVAVLAPVRVAVVSTGSELAEPGEELGPGRIPDANGVALAAAAASAGAAVVHRGRVADDPARFSAELAAAVASGAELVITSAGISMGDHEVVREVLEPLGARVVSVAMQPGGPQATARWNGVPIVCFPGNPVSSQLSFELFVGPVLREIASLPPARTDAVPLAHAIDSPPGRRQFLRGRRRSDGTVATVAGPGSHLVAALAAAEILIVVPEDAEHLEAGTPVEVVDL